MDAIIAQVKNLAKTADEAGRRKMIESLRNVQFAIETPNDMLRRLCGLHLTQAMARVGVDVGIFEALNESREPLSVATLAQKTSASPELLGRILRFLAAEGLVKETSKDHFTSNSTTSALADKNHQGAIIHLFDTIAPIFQKLPDFLAETKYESITDNTKTPAQQAWNTELPFFVWLSNQAERFGNFQKFMTIQRAGTVSWLSAFPFKEELGDFQGRTVFVDIGGGFGHQCIALKETFPELAGKLILEDQSQTLAQAPEIDGVEAIAHDFFKPQVVKGAKFYYLRNVLHNWSDEDAVLILKNLIPALGPDSRILIDEMVFPDEKVHWLAAQGDMAMMSILSSKQRTDGQWRALLDAAGLRISKIFQYSTPLNESIIMAVPK